MTAKKKAVQKKTGKSSSGGKQRPFPVFTLSKALAVPAKIKELNGGNPHGIGNRGQALFNA